MKEQEKREIEWGPYRPERERRDFGKVLGVVVVLIVVIMVALWLYLVIDQAKKPGKTPAAATAVRDGPTLEERVERLEKRLSESNK